MTTPPETSEPPSTPPPQRWAWVLPVLRALAPSLIILGFYAVAPPLLVLADYFATEDGWVKNAVMIVFLGTLLMAPVLFMIGFTGSSPRRGLLRLRPIAGLAGIIASTWTHRIVTGWKVERFEPLVEALHQYQTREGRRANNLNDIMRRDLPPDYFADFHYDDVPSYSFSEVGEGWKLSVGASQGIMDFSFLVYHSRPEDRPPPRRSIIAYGDWRLLLD